VIQQILPMVGQENRSGEMWTHHKHLADELTILVNVHLIAFSVVSF
jgi:hypothetical protein